MRELVIDTNLLVLFVVGSMSEALIGRHKRTKVFDVPAYRKLLAIVRQAPTLVVTAPVLTETSNLLRQCEEPLASRLAGRLADLVRAGQERTVPAIQIVSHQDYPRLGFADAGLLSLGDPDAVLLTVDNGLYLATLDGGRTAINFDHLRN